MTRDKIIKWTSIEFVEFIEEKRLFATNTVDPFKEYRMFEYIPLFDEFERLYPNQFHWHGIKSFVANLGHYARYCGYSYQLRTVDNKKIFRFFPPDPVAEKMMQRAVGEFVEGIKSISDRLKK